MRTDPEMSREGREVLRLWKGCDEAELKKDLPNYLSAGLIMPEVLKKLDVERAYENTQVRYIWENMISPVIQAHAYPEGLRKGTLFVKVDSSAWLSELVRFHRHEILKNMQASLGKTKITKISFSL